MRVELNDGNSRGQWAYLRPLTGHDELALDVDSNRAGTWLLERLLMDGPGAAVAPASLGTLDMGNRDRLLAALFRACFGDRIDGINFCANCSSEYEFSFSLNALTEHLAERQAPSDLIHADGPDDERFYRMEGMRFRLPTVADVDAVRALPPGEAMPELLHRCIDAATGPADENAIQLAMDQLAPSLDLDIDTNCPNCAQPGTITFSLEAFLLQALAQERRFLTLEIHWLATAYGWSLTDILSLNRDDRRALVRQVERQRFSCGRR
jgi:hypothetical protein